MKKVIFLSVIALVALWSMALVMEPNASNAATADVTVTETVDADITVSVDDATISLGNIGGVTGGLRSSLVTDHATTWTVKTNNPDGWKLELAGGNSGKLCRLTSGCLTNDKFDAYTGGGTLPSYNWQNPAAGSAQYGYVVTASSGTGNEFVPDRYFDDTSACSDAGRGHLGSCYDSLAASQTIGTSADASAFAGDTVTMHFQSEMVAGSGFYLNPGTYTSVVTGTASTLP